MITNYNVKLFLQASLNFKGKRINIKIDNSEDVEELAQLILLFKRVKDAMSTVILILLILLLIMV